MNIEIKAASIKIWTQVINFISYQGFHYAKTASWS